MKIYIAGSVKGQKRLQAIATCLDILGYTVISHWVWESNAQYNILPLEEWSPRAVRDLYELRGGDCIILDLIDNSTTGGRDVEWGYMLHRPGIQRYIVGPIRNVFHTLASRRWDTWEECLEWFKLSTAYRRDT